MTRFSRFAALLLTLLCLDLLAFERALAQEDRWSPERRKNFIANRWRGVGPGLGGPAACLPQASLRANALERASSPYLAQHAHNPVAWLPWSEETLERARRENRLIFLSVGYSTCHWCHVMERESFEDEAIAQLLNENYIAIKLDREERPDVDEVMMSALMKFTGGNGGWPMSLFLSPEGKPFAGETYLTPAVFTKALRELSAEWQRSPETIHERAKVVVSELRKELESSGDRIDLNQSLCDAAVIDLEDSLDRSFGGFSTRAPKFPQAMKPLFLLRSFQRTGRGPSLEAALRSLDAMAEGGLQDQLAGGFHRYSTDREWLVPHFEKMLYDNALLLEAYSWAWQLTRAPRYRDTARSTIRWLEEAMLLDGGAFASALDADTEGVEGRFYVWTLAELRAILDSPELDMACLIYGLREHGNFHEIEGASVLTLTTPLSKAATVLGLSVPQAEARFARVRKKLLEARGKRVPPARDDKVLTAWNGLTIRALASAARRLEDPEVLPLARKAASFVLEKLRRPDGRLLRSYRAGQTTGLGGIDDYAFLTSGLFELFTASGEARWLQSALELEAETRRLFLDAEGFMRSASDVKDVLARSRDATDGAMPPGIATAAQNALRVARLTGNDEALAAVKLTLLRESLGLQRFPQAYVSLLHLAEDLFDAAFELVIAAPDAKTAELHLDVAASSLRPQGLIIPLLGDEAPKVRALLPKFAEGHEISPGKTTAWLCIGQRCLPPIEDFEELAHALRARSP
jgi:uncharacterized protein YyaL (SSP411 family)